MKFSETSIPGAYVVDLKRMQDHRGFFAHVWSEREFAEMGLPTRFPDVNFSHSVHKATIRGIHYQKAPHEEARFVRCTSGALFDVIIDLRPGSPTFLQWAGFEINALSHQAIFVPAGCAHGVQTLEDDTGMLYMVSVRYHPEAELGIRWNDPLFAIDWPETRGAILSDKDQSWADFNSHLIQPCPP